MLSLKFQRLLGFLCGGFGKRTRQPDPEHASTPEKKATPESETEGAMQFDARHSQIKTRGGHVGSYNTVQNVSLQIQPTPQPRLEPKRCPAPSRHFTGRKDVLAQLEQYFFHNEGLNPHTFVLWGLGGSGKSQIAFKFIHDVVGTRFKHVFFIDATTTSTIEQSLKDIGSSTAVTGNGGNPRLTTSDQVLNWFSHLSEDWIMLFDNHSDPNLSLRSYFPRSVRGKILITTRDRFACQQYANGPNSSYHVSNMPPEDAADLLLKSSKLDSDVDAPRNHEPASLLAEEIGYLALALAQAGASIFKLDISISEYHDLFKARKIRIMADDSVGPQSLDGYQATVLTTWLISYERMTPLAAKLLDVCAFMHYNGITERIFSTATERITDFRDKVTKNMPPPSTSAGGETPDSEEIALLDAASAFLDSFREDSNPDKLWEKLEFNKAICEIRSYSLIDYDNINENYSIHPLVSEWTRAHCLRRNDGGHKITEYILAIAALKVHTKEESLFRQRLLLHIDAWMTDRSPSDTSANVAEVFGLVYQEAGRWVKAEALRRHVLEKRTEIMGDDHPSTLAAMIELATTLRTLGRFGDAADIQVKVVEESKKILGEENRDTLKAMANLSSTLHLQGRWKEAEVLKKEVLELCKKALGEDDLDTILAMANVAVTLHAQARWAEAEVLKHQVLDKRRRLLGENHVDTLRAKSNLAVTLCRLGRWDEAEALQAQVLEQKKPLGEEHPDTLHAKGDLAMTMQNHGKFQEAMALLEQVLEGRRKAFGEDHHYTVQAMGWVATTHAKLGEWEEARKIWEQVLEKRRLILGNEHPETYGTMHDLASALGHLGRFDEAGTLAKEALDGRRRVLHEDGADTKKTEELVSWIEEQRRQES